MRRFVLLVMLCLVATACGGSEEGAETTLPPTTETSGPSTTSAPTTTSQPTSSTSAPTTSTSPPTTTEPQATTTLPGEVIEFGPAVGDTVAVIGVAHDDVLNLRSGPGVDFDVVAEVAPLEDGLVALGETRDIGQAFWVGVDHDDQEGWVNFRFIAHLGQVTDETAATVDQLGERPTEQTMEELGRVVADSFSSEQPPSEIVQVSEVAAGDLGEVIFDVIGLGDDALVGFRVHVFGEPVDGGFSLRNVEVTTLCGRGATDDGFCL